MPDETPNQIENNTSAQVQGIITGIVKGITSNWREIAIGASIVLSAYNHFEESKEAKTSEKQRGLLWHETHRVDQAVGISVTETNKP